jgi:hypothetical protein
MWKQENQDVKDHYQALAQASREQHQRDYPGYKYAPRRPGERKRRGVHHEIVFGDSETVSSNEDSLKSPVEYGMSPTPSSDYFRFTAGSYCFQDMLGVAAGVESSDEFNVGPLPSSHSTPCVAAASEWPGTPPMDQSTEICVDAGHPDLEYDGPNAYGVYQGN